MMEMGIVDDRTALYGECKKDAVHARIVQWKMLARQSQSWILSQTIEIPQRQLVLTVVVACDVGAPIDQLPGPKPKPSTSRELAFAFVGRLVGFGGVYIINIERL